MSSRSETALAVYRRLSPVVHKVEDATSTAVAIARRSADVPAIHKLTDGVELIYPKVMKNIDPAEFKSVIQDPIVGVEIGVAAKRRLAGKAAGAGAAIAGVGFGALGYSMYETDLTVREALIQQGVPEDVVAALPDAIEALTMDSLLADSTLVVDGDRVTIDHDPADAARMGQSPPDLVEEHPTSTVPRDVHTYDRRVNPAFIPGTPEWNSIDRFGSETDMAAALRSLSAPPPPRSPGSSISMEAMGAWNRLTGANEQFGLASEAQLLDLALLFGVDLKPIALAARRARGD